MAYSHKRGKRYKVKNEVEKYVKNKGLSKLESAESKMI
jgi:hypothetical protein